VVALPSPPRHDAMWCRAGAERDAQPSEALLAELQARIAVLETQSTSQQVWLCMTQAAAAKVCARPHDHLVRAWDIALMRIPWMLSQALPAADASATSATSPATLPLGALMTLVAELDRSLSDIQQACHDELSPGENFRSSEEISHARLPTELLAQALNCEYRATAMIWNPGWQQAHPAAATITHLTVGTSLTAQGLTSRPGWCSCGGCCTSGRRPERRWLRKTATRPGCTPKWRASQTASPARCQRCAEKLWRIGMSCTVCSRSEQPP